MFTPSEMTAQAARGDWGGGTAQKLEDCVWSQVPIVGPPLHPHGCVTLAKDGTCWGPADL